MSSSQPPTTPSKRKAPASNAGTPRTPKTPRVAGPVIPLTWQKSVPAELTKIRSHIAPEGVEYTGDPDVLRRLDNDIKKLTEAGPSPVKKGRAKAIIQDVHPERKVWVKREDCPLLDKLSGEL